MEGFTSSIALMQSAFLQCQYSSEPDELGVDTPVQSKSTSEI
jgi:hypothetical protein